MCDWNAAELLAEWGARAAAELQRLGARTSGVHDHGERATVAFEGRGFAASVTAWPTGMLELDARAVGAREADVRTEKRHGRAFADAVLDEWFVVLRGLATEAR